MKSVLALFLVIATAVSAQRKAEGNVTFIENGNGQTIAFSPGSGISILKINGLSFKDLNKNGKLDKYEDWRLPFEVRAKDLATKMTVEQIAGLMLYSRHQSIPARSTGYFAGTYNGKPYTEGETNPAALTDQQKEFLSKDNLRHILITTYKSLPLAVEWNNNIQAYAESIGLGIPANNSTDPRHGTIANAEFNAAAGGNISMWPGSLGLAATFNPALVKKFGETVAIEYRALGITTALSPQIDIATDPRWSRVSGTFGENPYLSATMGQAYCEGLQTSYGKNEIENGWGYASVNAMAKHWPGGGTGEGGRDAHYAMGKYAVYPGQNFNAHLIPFTNGAFNLNSKTKMAAAVMPYYTISWNQDIMNKENVGNAYNKYIITGLLRKKYNYNGVVCTDWRVTGDETALSDFIGGTSWGAEKLTVAERHYKILMAGVDQFGGNNEVAPIMEAYAMGVKEHGESFMRKRMEQSAVRLLLNIFRVGLFENPYLDAETTVKTVGSPELMKSGYEAQLQSIVLLKNQQNVLPIAKNKTVYVPKKFYPYTRNFLGIETKERTDYPVNMNIVKKYFNVTDNPDEADFALVFINNAMSASGGYDTADIKNGGNGYVPISLQYLPYTSVNAREVSIAGGDPLEKFTNRSYKGKTVNAFNITDLAMVTETQAKMKGKPVIVSVTMDNPMVFSEFEKQANAILVNFRVQDQALLDIITGAAEPAALLPMQMPASMEEVERQNEDVPGDMKCHKDAEGHVYDFGFGMNWKGVIRDERVKKFKK
ncbi:MAG: glycoside hydrolase family 3 N-terminal domain-containing protein [Chitinophagaceae bacterium]|nr:glycoside hydrolase family 3 N-terminal domain-containing protein [Chitinophagaceae bacterium]